MTMVLLCISHLASAYPDQDIDELADDFEDSLPTVPGLSRDLSLVGLHLTHQEMGKSSICDAMLDMEKRDSGAPTTLLVDARLDGNFPSSSASARILGSTLLILLSCLQSQICHLAPSIHLFPSLISPANPRRPGAYRSQLEYARSLSNWAGRRLSRHKIRRFLHISRGRPTTARWRRLLRRRSKSRSISRSGSNSGWQTWRESGRIRYWQVGLTNGGTLMLMVAEWRR